MNGLVPFLIFNGLLILVLVCIFVHNWWDNRKAQKLIEKRDEALRQANAREINEAITTEILHRNATTFRTEYNYVRYKVMVYPIKELTTKEKINKMLREL